MAEKKKFMDDFEEYEVTEDHHPSRIGTVIRFIFYGLILLVNGAIIFRVCMAEDPKSVKSFEINDSLREAYAESPDDFTVYTQTVFDMYTEDGIYYSTGMFLCPAAEQLQIAVRYNIRTADEAISGTSIGSSYASVLDGSGLLPISPLSGEILRRGAVVNISIPESEMRSGDFFTFRLSDDHGNYYMPSGDSKTTRILYVYHKLTFDGVSCDDSNLYVEIYPCYKGTPDYSTVLGRMKVYSTDRSLEEYHLSNSEKSKLAS